MYFVLSVNWCLAGCTRPNCAPTCCSSPIVNVCTPTSTGALALLDFGTYVTVHWVWIHYVAVRIQSTGLL